MKKRANNEIFLPKIMIAIALIAILGVALWGFFGQDTVAVQNAKEAYAQYLSENPGSQDKDFIYIYEDTVIVAIRNGKVVRKEYATEADAVKAALGSKDGANYSLAGTGDGKLFVVKLFQKTDDIYALGTSTLATGAEKLSIKVVSNGMIFATFDIPAEAIDRKESPVCITVKKINPEDNVKLGKNETGFAYDIDVTNLVKDNTARIAITMNGPRGLLSDNLNGAITAYHKDKNIVSTYDSTTGKISFSTASFSPFTFTWEEIVVNNLEDLRYYLQLSARVNIKLGDEFGDIVEETVDGVTVEKHLNTITIDLTKDGVRDDNVTDPTTANKDSDGVYYSSGYFEDEDGEKHWHYFGALVFGEKSLDLNGKTIVYKSDASKYDSALFAVGDNASFTIKDSKSDSEDEEPGIIAIKYDQYAVWAVNDSSTVNILSGIFMADEYANADADPNRALVYSSGGEINVRGGYFLYENINGGKTNGGFNVLDGITVPRIWIYEGVYLSNNQFRQTSGNDDDSIMLIGGASCSNTAAEGKTVVTLEATPKEFKYWYSITGQALRVKDSLNEDKYIYRVGNGNAFALSAFFEEVKEGTAPENISVRVVNIIGTRNEIEGIKYPTDDETGKKGPFNKDYYTAIGDSFVNVKDYTSGYGLSSTLTLSGFTGPVRLELCDADNNNALCASIYLEVVDGKNITAASELSSSVNNVLLNDIAIASGGTFTLNSGKTLFGNGYTFDITAGSYAKTTYGVITLSSATLDNVKIVGKPFSTFVNTHQTEYYAAAVNASGNSQILNSYVSGCQMPIRFEGTTCLVENTTLYGGRYCNLQHRAGVLTLKNVTTVQKLEKIDGKNCIGLGILVYDAATSGTKVIVDGSLTQYNWVTSNQSGLPTGASTFAGKAFEYPEYVYEYNETKYVNLGIISMSADVLHENITILTDIGYSKQDVQSGSNKGCVATCDNTLAPNLIESTIVDYDANGGWSATQQGAFKPTFVWNHPSEYNEATGSINVVFEKGNQYTLDITNIRTAKKYGNNLDIKIYLDSKDNPIALDANTGKYQIVFKDTQAGSHTLIIETTDPYNYSPGAIAVSKTYEETVPIEVTVNEPDAKNAVFTYVSGLDAVVEQINGDWYVWPNASATSNTIYSTTVDGKTVYMPIVKGTIKKNTSDGTAYAPIFSAINIKDFDGDVEITYNKDTPKEALPVETKFHFADKNITPFTAHNEKVAGKENNSSYGGLCYYSEAVGSNHEAKGQTVKYFYTDNAGTTYYYYIRYEYDKFDKPCVTPDTLITLADGRQVRVDSLTGEELLLVWNLKTGKYEAAPIVFVDSDAEEEFEIIHLYFSDGSDVKVIYEHGFFDLDLGKYVYIDANNYADYVGHRFVTEDDISKDTWNVVTLDKVNIETEVTTAWSPVTFEHLCYYTNGVLSMPGGIEGLFNIFEVDTDTMTYDAEKMAQDIATYGLLSLDDFGGMIPQAAFDAFNGQYLNVAIGKGLLTWEQIAALAERYVPLM